MQSSKPCSTKNLMAQASRARLPDAKPWYAQSKKGKWSFARIADAISRHWDSVGSTPVGLWAQACRRMMLPRGADLIAESMPSKSRPLVLALKYGYVLMGR